MFIKEDFNKSVYISASRNHTERMINSMGIEFMIYNNQGDLLYEFLANMKNIKPNYTKKGLWEVDPNMFNSKEMELYDTSNSGLQFRTKLKRIVFNNEETLTLKESL